jgi:hypothetical protein
MPIFNITNLPLHRGKVVPQGCTLTPRVNVDPFSIPRAWVNTLYCLVKRRGVQSDFTPVLRGQLHPYKVHPCVPTSNLGVTFRPYGLETAFNVVYDERAVTLKH